MALVFSGDGTLLVSVSAEDMMVVIWNVIEGKQLSLTQLSAPITAFDMHISGQLIAVGDKLGGLHMLELTDLDTIDESVGRFPGPPSVTPTKMCNAMRHKW